MMDDVETLRTAFYKARDDLEKAEGRVFKQQATELFLGKCHKYRNSGGVNGGRWWLYRKVTGIRGRQLIGLQFQTQPDGHFSVERNVSFGWVGGVGSAGWTEISNAAFAREFNKAIKRVEKLAHEALGKRR